MSITIGSTPLSEFKISLPAFQGLIRTISRLDDAFIYNTKALPESFIGQQTPESGEISYGVLSQNYEELIETAGEHCLFDELTMLTLSTAGDGLPGQTALHDDVTKELVDLEPLELDTLLHVYLASGRGHLNSAIDTLRNDGDFTAPQSLNFAISEATRNLFLAQNYLRLMNRSDRNYFYEGGAAVDQLVHQHSRLLNNEKPASLDETELYRLARLSLAHADATMDELEKVSPEYGDIDRNIRFAADVTKVARTLLAVKGLQLESVQTHV